MLKKFFLNTLSSFMGAWIALVLFVVALVLVGVGIAAKFGASDTSKSVTKGSVLVIDLKGSLVERETPADFDFMSLIQGGGMDRPQTLENLVKAIGEAEANKNIDMIYLKCRGMSAGAATLDALRHRLVQFKESGKKIVAYGDYLTTGDYFVSSVADSLFLNPDGHLLLYGMSSSSLFMKGLFDKLGIEFQVVKVGTYKSAVEPYINTEMSAPARAQLEVLLGDMWRYISEHICEERYQDAKSTNRLDSAVNALISVRRAQDVLQAGLVDKLCYEREMDGIVAQMAGREKDDLNFVSPADLLGQTDWAMEYGAKNQIAVVYATGEIADGAGNKAIDFNNYVPLIMDLAENEKVKAVVLRVNSPGGSAFGSDQIGEALDCLRETCKPLVVSMGDYAASGGYWISCCADRIFANPLTITGSIGIFGLIPNAAGLLDKIGVSPQFVSTNPEADFRMPLQPMTARQKEAMQANVENGYNQFITRVATGRDMTAQYVDSIGQGRVWGAEKALELGLIDEIGYLEDAIEWAQKQIDAKDKSKGKCTVVVYPKVKPSFWDYLPEDAMDQFQKAVAKHIEGDYTEVFAQYVTRMLRQKHIQARMPYVDVRL